MSPIQNTLYQLETRLRTLIEGSAALFFPAYPTHQDLARQIVEAIQLDLHKGADGSWLAPNLLTIFVPAGQARAIQENSELSDELTFGLQQALREAGLRLPAPPEIRILPDPEPGALQAHVVAQFSLEENGQTYLSGKSNSNGCTSSAFLIVDGVQVFPLSGMVINIGRGPDNHLIIDDLRVSRAHAQLRLVSRRYMIFDLGSTGGTFVNGKKVVQGLLAPGDLISLAGVPLVFGMEPEQLKGDTQELVEPPDEV